MKREGPGVVTTDFEKFVLNKRLSKLEKDYAELLNIVQKLQAQRGQDGSVSILLDGSPDR